MTADCSESQQKRITVTVDSDMAEWIEKQAAERRIGEATFVRMMLADVMRLEKVGGVA